MWRLQVSAGTSSLNKVKVRARLPLGSFRQASVARRPLSMQMLTLFCSLPAAGKDLFSSPSWMGAMTFFHMDTAGLLLELMRSGLL